MITKKQKEVLDFLNKYSKEKGYAPSLDEIRSHFKLASVSTAHYYVDKLSKEGYLDKTANQPRSIDISSSKPMKSVAHKEAEYFSIPILGSASAGIAMMFAEANIFGYLRVAQRDLSRKEGVFALRVKGDSMNRAKIAGKNLEEGDYVLVDSEYNNPRSGDYVLSVIDGFANLKRFQKDKKGVRLMPESRNPKHKPIHISSHDDFMINGKIIKVIKK
ncbi:MAG: transcriptional repressor LexA [bacterium]|nr:transcriptional repressor LexA [bacterium]